MDRYEHDLEQTAIHEAGHVVAAAAEGCFVRSWIEETNTDNPGEEMLVIGRTEFIHAIPLSPVVAVAGAVAECLWENPDYDAFEILDFIVWDDDLMSATDKKGWPEDGKARLAAVETAIEILRKYEAFRYAVTRQLVDERVITDGMVAEMAEAFDVPR